MEDRRYVWGSIGLFCVLTVVLCAPLWALIANAGEKSAGRGLLVTAVMWGPGIAGLLTRRIRAKHAIALGWDFGRWKFNFLGYAIPIAYMTIVYVIVWAVYPGSFNEGFLKETAASFHWQTLSPASVALLYLVLQATAGMVEQTAKALGEEIGWRGFLVPNLSRVLPFGGTALFSGVVWAAWHFPLILYYHGGPGVAYRLTIFTVAVVADSFLYAWLRLRSASLWPCVLMHASFNLFCYYVFAPLTVETGIEHVIGEYGFALMVANVVIVIPVWLLRGRVSDAKEQVAVGAI